MEPLFSFSGLASGIDTASIVSALVQVERQPISRLESEQDTLRNKKDKFNLLADDLKALQTAARALDNRTKVLSTAATSSQESAVGITAEGGASLGKFDVTVSKVATAQRTYSDPVASSTTAGLFGTGTLDITAGSDPLVSINIDANSTLESIAGAINGSGANVTAGILFTGSEYHLQVTGRDTGLANAITFAETGSVSLNLTDTKQAADDAAFTVDGFVMSSDTNIVTGAIPGVTLNLKGQTTGAASLSIDQDPDALADTLTAFVDAYNAIDTRIDFEMRNPGEAETDSLFGEQIVRSIQSKMRSAVISPVSGLSGPYNYLASIGVSIDRDGALSLDKGKLEEALATDSEAVAELLMEDPNTGVTGVMGLVDDLVQNLTSSTSGLLSARTDGIDDRVQSLDDQILRMEDRLDNYAEQLRREFTAMEVALSSIQGQGAQLASMLGLGT